MNNQVETKPVSIGDWIVTYLLLCIPLVNFIMLIVWAVQADKPSKSNWAKATLIWMILGVIIFMVFGATLMAGIASQSGY
ncbi:MAG: hypothetical protein RL336_1320 [Pseudomonadota bacterium]|jgi:hypothetical protein